MFKHFTKIFFSVLLIAFSFANFAKAETTIRVVDWQSGVGGITNSCTNMGENFYDYEQVQVNCPSCTTPEPIGLDKVWKDFNKVFLKDHTTPDELREKGVI